MTDKQKTVQPVLDERFITTIKGREFVLYAGLNEEFVEIGDANPRNVTEQIAGHVLRMAATRAKARALRDFTNIGMTCLEELGELDSVIGEEKPKPRATKRSPKKTPAKSKKPAPANGPKSESKVSSINTDQPRISQAQKKAILNLSRRRGINEDALEGLVQEAYGVSLEGLTSQDAAHFIRNLQQAA